MCLTLARVRLTEGSQQIGKGPPASRSARKQISRRHSLSLSLVPPCLCLLGCVEPSNQPLPDAEGSVRTAQTDSPNYLVSHTSFDFGEVLLIPGDPPVARSSSIKNVGKRTLSFAKPEISCGCATVTLSKPRVEPGGETELVVSVSSRHGKYGVFYHIARLSMAGDDATVLEFPVRGNLIPRLQTRPTQIHLGGLSAGQEAAMVIWAEVGLSSDEPAPRSIGVHCSTDPEVTVEPTGQTEFTLRPGFRIIRFQYKLLVTARGASHPNRAFVDFLVEGASYRMPVTWRVLPPVEAFPRSVSFQLRNTRPSERRVAIRYADAPQQRPVITRQEVHQGELQLRLIPTDNPKVYDLSLTVTPATGAQLVQGRVVLDTHDGQRPLLEVPFYGLVSHE